MYNKIKNIHLIGIGGIGMSGIAELLLRNGYAVSGSDAQKSDTVRRLESLGIRVHFGHAASHVIGAELVVFSSAIAPQNPERLAAVEKGIPLIPRGEMLAELMRLKYGIAVAGAHGKTTTTSMISLILVEAELDPTVVVGGRVDNFGGTNARLGSGEFMVVEADESDGSFNKLSPSIAIATNLDREHMEYYKSMKRLRRAFHAFLDKVPFYGLSVICGDDPHLRLIYPSLLRRKVSYGFGEDNHYQITRYQPTEQGSEFWVKTQKESKTEHIQLRVPGKHNALNAVAALAVADELSIPRERSIRGLFAFQGVQRRFHRRGQLKGVTFVDDYAHHPSEIAATISAAREQFKDRKIRVLFQPHRFSRFTDLFDRFSQSLRGADEVVVTEIYAAGETPITGISGKLLTEDLKNAGFLHSHFVKTPSEGLDQLREESSSGDVILTLGAGDLPSVYRDLF